MPESGTVLAGRYRLLSVIATGGMGVVWKGWDERLERPVAIKQLRPAPNVSEAEAEEAKTRALREARITGRLQHPHAVPVFDAVEHEGQPCLVMPFLDSTTLAAVLRDSRPLPLARVARIGAEVASALAAAHRLGIVHRDVKPGNILITADGAAHISDFGISHALGDATLTGTGLIHGTPAYLAPEAARGETAGFPADVFSLGSTLYAALEGAPPFGTDANPIALLHRVAAARVPTPTRAGSLTSVLMQMLSSDPESRPAMATVASVLADHVIYAQVDDESVRVSDAASPGVPTSVVVPGGSTTDQVARAAAQERDPSAAGSTHEESASALSQWFFAPDGTSAARAGGDGEGRTTGSPGEPGAARPGRAEASVAGASGAGTSVAATSGTATSGATAGPPSAEARRPSRAGRLAGVAAGAVLVVVTAGALLDDRPLDSTEVEGASAPTTSVAAPTPETGAAPTPRVLPTPAAATGTPSASATEPDPSTEPDPEAEPAPEAGPAAQPEPEQASQPEAAAVEPPVAPAPADVEPAPAAGATQLASAVTDYYALMPENTDVAWGRMTADYQTNHAGGFTSYDSFWNDIVDVQISDVQSTPPDGVVATLTYSFVDGRVVVERTAYRMVDEGGVLKIAASEVLSSRGG